MQLKHHVQSSKYFLLSLMSLLELLELQVVDRLSLELVFFIFRRLANGACSTAINAKPSLVALWKALYAALRAVSTKVRLLLRPRIPGVMSGVVGISLPLTSHL